MKTPEILLASGVIAALAGAGAALAARAFDGDAARAAQPSRANGAAAPATAPAVPGDVQATLEELRMENADLRTRLAALEARLADGVRAPITAEPGPDDDVEAELLAASAWSANEPRAIELDPGFVASVGRALVEIRAKEEEEREQKRKDLQAQRIEERVTKLQQELGLSARQASDLRTTLLAQDEKRETLLAGMRDGTGDPRDARDGFRTIRDETHTALQGFLTPEQFSAYRDSEESEFRRGFGDFGAPRPDDGGGRRQGR